MIDQVYIITNTDEVLLKIINPGQIFVGPEGPGVSTINNINFQLLT